jgi:hypothetical protein
MECIDQLSVHFDENSQLLDEFYTDVHNRIKIKNAGKEQGVTIQEVICFIIMSLLVVGLAILIVFYLKIGPKGYSSGILDAKTLEPILDGH